MGIHGARSNTPSLGVLIKAHLLLCSEHAWGDVREEVCGVHVALSDCDRTCVPFGLNDRLVTCACLDG